MQGIEFEEDKNYQGLKVETLSAPSARGGFIIKLLAKVGIEDKSTANIILLGIVAIFFGITIYIYAGVLGGNVPTKQSAEAIMSQQKAMKEMMGIK